MMRKIHGCILLHTIERHRLMSSETVVCNLNQIFSLQLREILLCRILAYNQIHDVLMFEMPLHKCSERKTRCEYNSL